MLLSRIFWSLLAGLLLACGTESRAPKPPQLGEAFPNLPLPPQPELISHTGGPDALQLTLRTPGEMAAILEYYRSILGSGNWRLVSDTKNRDGSVVLYAEQNGPPMWVRIWKSTDRPGTMIQLTGAVAPEDSTKRAK